MTRWLLSSNPQRSQVSSKAKTVSIHEQFSPEENISESKDRRTAIPLKAWLGAEWRKTPPYLCTHSAGQWCGRCWEMVENGELAVRFTSGPKGPESSPLLITLPRSSRGSSTPSKHASLRESEQLKEEKFLKEEDLHGSTGKWPATEENFRAPFRDSQIADFYKNGIVGDIRQMI